MNIKRILGCALLGFSVVTMVGCNSTEKEEEGTTETTGEKVLFTFPTENTYSLFDNVNLKSGVTVTGETTGNNFSQYTISCETPGIVEGTTLNTDNAGEFTLVYSYESYGIITTAQRVVTIVANGEIGENLLHVDYRNNYTNLDSWGIYDNVSKFSTENGNIIVDATVSTNDYQTRLDTDPNQIKLERGEQYQILIKAKATQARDIKIQVGNMFSDTPWWTGVSDPMIISLTTSMSTKAAYFTVAEDTQANLDEICMTLEMGDVGTFIPATIEIESISLHTFDGEVKDETKPTITQNKTYELASSTFAYDETDVIDFFDIKDNRSDRENITTSVEMIFGGVTKDVISNNDKGTWTIRVTATDEALNSTTSTFSFLVRDKVELNNYFTLSDDQSEFSSWADVNGYVNVVDGATIDDFTVEYAVYYFWYDPQFFISSQFIDDIGTYTLSFTLVNNTDRNITLGGTIGSSDITGQTINLLEDVAQTITFDVEVVNAGDVLKLQILFDVYSEGNLATNITPEDTYETLTFTGLSLTKK